MELRTSLVSAELVRYNGAAASLALLYRRKVFLILRYDHTWAFPGGSLEEGEKSLPGALREFVEEVGVAPPPYEILTAITGSTSRGRRHTLWIATIQEPLGELRLSEREVLLAKWVSPGEALLWENLHHGIRDNLLFLHYLPKEILE